MSMLIAGRKNSWQGVYVLKLRTHRRRMTTAVLWRQSSVMASLPTDLANSVALEYNDKAKRRFFASRSSCLSWNGKAICGNENPGRSCEKQSAQSQKCSAESRRAAHASAVSTLPQPPCYDLFVTDHKRSAKISTSSAPGTPPVHMTSVTLRK